MSARLQQRQRGITLVEVLVGMAIAAIVLLPLTEMLGAGMHSARIVRSALDTNADARFAIDRIAARATAATGATPTPAANASSADIATAWLAPVQYTLAGSDLVETDNRVSPARSSTIATNVTSLQLEAPAVEPGWRPLLRIGLTFDASVAGCGERCAYVRDVRLGARP